MDNTSRELIEYLEEGIAHSHVSGFEILELLDVRSKLAAREPILTDEDKARLEATDKRILMMVHLFVSRISEVADLAEMRKRGHVFPSHWWWYMDEIVEARQRSAGTSH